MPTFAGSPKKLMTRAIAYRVWGRFHSNAIANAKVNEEDSRQKKNENKN